MTLAAFHIRAFRYVPATLAAILFSAAAPAQTTPEGHWEGTLNTNSRELGLGLDIAKNVKSGWVASLSVPADNVTGLVVTDLVVNGQSVKFVGVELMMAKFDLTLGSGGTLKGTVSYPRGTTPVEFRRTGDAKVELIPPSPAVSDELEGDWEGTLQTPGRTLRILFHFKNQPDGTVAATIDTPDSGGIGLPLNAVKQTGRNVEVGIRIAHAAFQGALSSDASELTGQFIHDRNSIPLTLRKR